MSNAVYPTLPGLSFGVVRSPIWNTITKLSTSGREYRAARYTTPLYKYTLSYEFLRSASTYAELQTLVGFFNARRGSFDSFLFTDPDDNSVTAQLIGTGNGALTQFQLLRQFGGFSEPVYDLNGSPSVYVSGTLKTLGTDYTLSASGLITFSAALATGAAVTWTGSFYRRCRFLQDSLEFSKFMNLLWEAKKVEFQSVKP